MSKKLPKYILEAINRRAVLAEKLSKVCAIIDDYALKLDPQIDIDEACLVSNCRITCEPWGAAETTERMLQEIIDKINKPTSVQIGGMDLMDIKNNPNVRKKYPYLYEEVMNKDDMSSWYELGEIAYKDYKIYVADTSIGYWKNGELVNCFEVM